MSPKISTRSYLSAGMAAILGAAAISAGPAAEKVTAAPMPALVSAPVVLSSLDIPFPYPKEITGLLTLLDDNAPDEAKKATNNFLDYFMTVTAGRSLSEYVGNFPGAIYPSMSALNADLTAAGLGDFADVLQTMVDGKLPSLNSAVTGVDHFITSSIPGPGGVLMGAASNILIDVAAGYLTVVNHVGDALIALPGSDGTVEGAAKLLESALSDFDNAVYSISFDMKTGLSGGFTTLAEAIAPIKAAFSSVAAIAKTLIRGVVSGITAAVALIGPRIIGQSLATTLELVTPPVVSKTLKKVFPTLPLAASVKPTTPAAARKADPELGAAAADPADDVATADTVVADPITSGINASKPESAAAHSGIGRRPSKRTESDSVATKASESENSGAPTTRSKASKNSPQRGVVHSRR